jgi:hypothetical protein
MKDIDKLVSIQEVLVRLEVALTVISNVFNELEYVRAPEEVLDQFSHTRNGMEKSRDNVHKMIVSLWKRLGYRSR